jgi:hypothetical protein
VVLQQPGLIDRAKTWLTQQITKFTRGKTLAA